MDKRIFLTTALILVFFGSAFAGSISRDFSSITVQPGADLTVTLTATIDAGETYYLIDERLPSGWTIKDAGTGAAEHAGHIKWLVIENAANTAYTYTLTAPSQAGTTAFTGTYMMEGMASEAQILGQNQVIVGRILGQNQVIVVGQDYTLYALIVVAAIVIIVAAAVVLKKKKKVRVSIQPINK